MFSECGIATITGVKSYWKGAQLAHDRLTDRSRTSGFAMRAQSLLCFVIELCRQIIYQTPCVRKNNHQTSSTAHLCGLADRANKHNYPRALPSRKEYIVRGGGRAVVLCGSYMVVLEALMLFRTLNVARGCHMMLLLCAVLLLREAFHRVRDKLFQLSC